MQHHQCCHPLSICSLTHRFPAFSQPLSPSLQPLKKISKTFFKFSKTLFKISVAKFQKSLTFFKVRMIKVETLQCGVSKRMLSVEITVAPNLPIASRDAIFCVRTPNGKILQFYTCRCGRNLLRPYLLRP